MKTLVVYFSFTGNNRQLAEHLAACIGCDTCPVVEQKKRTALTVILDMVFRRKPKIKPSDYTFSDYNHIILVAPVWDSKVANPMQTLIRREKDFLSDYSFISLCGYDRPGQKDSLTKELSVLAGGPPKVVFELKICERLPAAQKNDVKAIADYQVTGDDFSAFEPQIREFLNNIIPLATARDDKEPGLA
ncbi:flavodoxin family protein [Exilibacterium tricleocarpae]|uniref:Flavodoxin family protein n=1 Tax=Exilibacterium tricleocarpae TaxID=2591008 RepID=A0A545TLH3_9GAMM|nr:flavodoxin family protein [Exilibacterium tricleocarpae]TQV78046.1 flavodoxin family protein [Exilibacterium tricleocarpae]